jgi:hypothetical protein
VPPHPVSSESAVASTPPEIHDLSRLPMQGGLWQRTWLLAFDFYEFLCAEALDLELP